MCFTEVGLSSFETTAPQSGFAKVFAHHDESNTAVCETRAENASNAEARPLGADRAFGRARARVAARVLGVAGVVGAAVLLHVVALVIAERTYAPYSVSRTGEYVAAETTTGIEARRLVAEVTSHPRRPRHR
jgi:hypothetical protein